MTCCGVRSVVGVVVIGRVLCNRLALPPLSAFFPLSIIRDDAGPRSPECYSPTAAQGAAFLCNRLMRLARIRAPWSDSRARSYCSGKSERAAVSAFVRLRSHYKLVLKGRSSHAMQELDEATCRKRRAPSAVGTLRSAKQ